MFTPHRNRLRVDVVQPQELVPHEGGPTLGDGSYRWHLLAEGDSWFTIGAIPSSNLLYELRLSQWTQVFNLGYPGDTLRRMSQLARNRDLKRFVAERKFRLRWDALLLSGGGNDLIDAAKDLIRPTPARGADAAEPAAWVHADALGQVMDDVQKAIRRIHTLWNSADSLSAGQPVFLHTYDFPTPRNAPALFLGGARLKGPWLYPALKDTATDAALRQQIADLLLNRLADALLALDEAAQGGDALPGVHVIDTRNTLVQANPADRGASNDWLNEIHPTTDGYRKIADQLSARIDAVLGPT